MHAKVFDVDGTLLQSASVDDRLYREAVRSVLGDVRFRASLHDYEFVTDSGILQQLRIDNELVESPSQTAQIKAAFLELVNDHIERYGPFQEMPGAREFFDRLRGADHCRVSIATGGWMETALRKLESAGFDMTDIPLASSDDAIDRREIMKISLDRLGSEFDTITYYGDGTWDRAASRSLGWRFVAVGSELGGIRSFFDVPVD